MKRKSKLLIVLILVAVIAALLVFPVGRRFPLPFETEDVSFVILWSFWGYKEARESREITMIVEEMSDIRLCREFDYENYEPRDGDYSYNICFFLNDGSAYEYEALPKPGLTTVFRDADGTYYKAKNVPLKAIYNNLAQDPQFGN